MKNKTTPATVPHKRHSNGQKVPFKKVPNDIANQMVRHYLDEKAVDHSLNAIVRMIYLSKKQLACLCEGEVETVKFIIAAYLDNDADMANRNQPTVLIQQKMSDKGNRYIYYDMKKPNNPSIINESGFCPPPPEGCGTESQTL